MVNFSAVIKLNQMFFVASTNRRLEFQYSTKILSLKFQFEAELENKLGSGCSSTIRYWQTRTFMITNKHCSMSIGQLFINYLKIPTKQPDKAAHTRSDLSLNA